MVKRNLIVHFKCGAKVEHGGLTDKQAENKKVKFKKIYKGNDYKFEIE